MVHCDGVTGTWILDRRLGKLGRLKIASGTTDRDEFLALNTLITKLKRERRWDLLSLLTQRIVPPLELADAIFRGDVGALPTAEELYPLAAAFARWLTGADLAERTKAGYRRLLASLTGTLHQLPALLAADRVAAVQSGKRASYNARLDAVRAFLRDTLPADHRLGRLLPARLDVTHRPGNPQELDQVRVLAGELRHADELWALCLTGMRAGEYWGAWTALTDRVQVAGTKTRAAARAIPLVYPIARPQISHAYFYELLQAATGKAVNVHDLRKTCQHWQEEAGLVDWHIKLYAGHALERDLRVIYRKPRDLTRILREDADKMRAYLGEPPRIGLQVVNG